MSRLASISVACSVAALFGLILGGPPPDWSAPVTLIYATFAVSVGLVGASRRALGGTTVWRLAWGIWILLLVELAVEAIVLRSVPSMRDAVGRVLLWFSIVVPVAAVWFATTRRGRDIRPALPAATVASLLIAVTAMAGSGHAVRSLRVPAALWLTLGILACATPVLLLTLAKPPEDAPAEPTLPGTKPE